MLTDGKLKIQNMKSIVFYRVSEPYGEFSNFSPHPIKLKGLTWPTSEHYFQAQKFVGTEHEEAADQKTEAAAAFHLLMQLIQMMVLDGEMMIASIHVKEDRRGTVKGLCVRIGKL